MLFNKLREYIEPSNLEIHIYVDGIYIVNYKLISSFNSNKIVIEKEKEKATVIGNDLVISRLKKDELFISGNINEILFR